jgi:hypothetical protein
MFRMLKCELDRDNELREKIARAKFGPNGELNGFREIVRELEKKIQVSDPKSGADESQRSRQLDRRGDLVQSTQQQGTGHCPVMWHSRISDQRPSPPKWNLGWRALIQRSP